MRLLLSRTGWLISGSTSWPSACLSTVPLWRSCAGHLGCMTKTVTEPLRGRKCWRSCRCVCVCVLSDISNYSYRGHRWCIFQSNCVSFCPQAVYKMSVAAALTKANSLTAEECTNRIFVRLDKDNNGEEMIFPFCLKSWCGVISTWDRITLALVVTGRRVCTISPFRNQPHRVNSYISIEKPIMFIRTVLCGITLENIMNEQPKLALREVLSLLIFYCKFCYASQKKHISLNELEKVLTGQNHVVVEKIFKLTNRIVIFTRWIK